MIKKYCSILSIIFFYYCITAPQLYAKEEQKETLITATKAPTQKNDVADIYLNFEDASLAGVVNYLAEQKKINFIPHKDLINKKVSLTTRQPLTLQRAWDVLLTLLEMNGFTIINVDNVYRIVPNRDNKKEPLPLYSSNKGVSPEDLPDSDLVVRYIYILKNITTEVAQKILGDLLGREKVQINRDLATCIITDKCNNIKSAMKIINELDTGGLRESIKIIRLRHTDSKEISDLFSREIMEGQRQEQQKTIRFIGPKEKKEITYFSSTTKIIPEERHNALILLGLEQNIDRVIEFINKYLDVPMKAAESRIHIKELKYVEATKIKPIIEAMTKPPSGKNKSPIVGDFKFFEDVVVHAENPKSGEDTRGSGNRLIISCNRDDWKRLEKLIKKLDKPQPQVALEIIIVDIDGQQIRNLGTQIREKTGKSFAQGMNAYTFNLSGFIPEKVAAPTDEDPTATKMDEYSPNLIKNADGKQGTTSITIGKDGDIWAVIKSFLSSTHTNIISQPFMITKNNTPCTLTIDHEKRVPGKLTGGVQGGQTSLQEWEEVVAKTELKITPRINIAGLVDLQISIDLSEFLGTGGSDTPNRSTRKVVTRTTIATGEVLVLGGLTKNKIIEAHAKTPILGNVPFLGNLFKSKNKTLQKTNLYIFIRPSIIKPQFEGGPDDYTQLKLDYAKYQIMNVEDIRTTKDPIQRWFFKPEKQSIKQKLADLRKGVYRPIDNYAEGRSQPDSVRIERDLYFRATEEIEKVKGKEAIEQEKKLEFKEQKQRPKELVRAPLPSLRKRRQT